MNLSLIVATSTENAIGKNGDLPWRLSSDLKRFRRLTMGHHLILGRKTYESIGRALPGRQMIVVTRNRNFEAEHAWVAHDIDAALALAKDDAQPFVIGGSDIYQILLPQVQTIYLTKVATTVPDADAYFPEVDWQQWESVESVRFDAGDQDEFATTFSVLKRR